MMYFFFSFITRDNKSVQSKSVLLFTTSLSNTVHIYQKNAKDSTVKQIHNYGPQCNIGEPTALALLDLSAIFDTIDHFQLSSDLFGVGSSILKCLTSYLSEHYQSIKIGSTLIYGNFYLASLKDVQRVDNLKARF